MNDNSIKNPDRRRFAVTGLALGGAALVSHSALATTPATAPAAAQSSGPIVLHGVSPRLTIHILDTYHGQAAVGLRVDFSSIEGGRHVPIRSVTINPNGRSDEPLLIGDTYREGNYEVLLHVDDYFAMKQAKLPRPGFLSKIPIRFQVRNTGERIHLPIQFSPWNYTYYRGS
ncbi:MAG TPA: hydroxyisourate hydrolase [Noviherbaspirillum sp.]|nr:hydroxyisourate hydrolase [Noviherbaspirillum sp.]